MPDHPPQCLHEDRWDHIQDALKRIESQTQRTNGRVGMLEKWQWLVTGAVLVLGSIFGAKLGALSAMASIVSK